jgi:hypothetical protein
MAMIRPAFGRFVARVSLPALAFAALIACWLDELLVRAWVPTMYLLFLPLDVAFVTLWKAHRALPYVWDATWV